MKIIQDNIDFAAFMEEQEAHNVRPASDWLEATIGSFYPTGPAAKAPGLMWGKCGDKVLFPGGEVTLWAGINGHGKSTFLSQVELDLCRQDERVMVASFEMRPVAQMVKMSRQAYAGRYPSKEFLSAFHAWTNNRLWIYDHVGSVDWKRVIAVMRYARKNFGITQFVVDSLMKCVKGEDDYNGQKNFVDELCAFAQANDAHVHLAHHIRKGENEYKMPGKFDAKGAGGITDLVDNMAVVWKNKKALEDANSTDPTCMVAIEKQRHRDFEGKFGFWFEEESQQFLEHKGHVPFRYPVGMR